MMGLTFVTFNMFVKILERFLKDFLLDNHFSVIYTTVRHEQFRSVNIKENENE